MRERDHERKGTEYAMRIGYFFHCKFKSENNRSVHDHIYINRHGVTVYIEYKREGKKATKAQAEKHRRMGCPVTPGIVSDNLETTKEFLDHYNNARVVIGDFSIRRYD